MIASIALIASAAVGQPLPKAAFDCKKARIEHHPIVDCDDEIWFGGAFRGPRIHGQPTIEIRYTTGHGTGVKFQNTALLQKHGSIYRMLWSHDRFSAWSGWPSKDGVEFYRWAYDPRRDRIVVTGTKTVGTVLNVWEGVARGHRTPLPRENYCYSDRRNRFQRC